MPRDNASVRCSSFSIRPTAGVAIFLHDAEHVAVEIRFSAVLNSWNRQAEADHAAGIESAEGLTADFSRGDEQAHRQEFDLFESPDQLLQGDGFHKFIVRMSARISIMAFGILPQRFHFLDGRVARSFSL